MISAFKLCVSILLLLSSAAFAQRYRVTDLGALRPGSAVPAALNNSGEVAGRSGMPHGEMSHAFVWSGARIHDLETLPGGDYSAAFCINNFGDIVVYSHTARNLRSFLWTRSTGL